MKKLAVLFSLILAFSFSIQAEKTELGTYKIPQDQKERIVLENEIGKGEFLNPELVSNLVDCRVVRITYVYSAYAPDGFDQDKLNESRIQNLHELVDFDQRKIKWDEVAQTDCRTGSCAKEMLHGFVIDFVPKKTFHYGRIEKQTFHMNGREGKSLKGKNGTEIQIPANCFTFADGTPVKGALQIELREALDFENIVKGNLLTMTNEGDLLQTGGMIQVQAYSNGKNLKLKEGKALNIGIPNDDKREGMKFYSGEVEDGNIVWNNPADLGLNEINIEDEEIEASRWKNGFGVLWWGTQPNELGKHISRCDWKRADKVTRFTITIDEKKYVLNSKDFTLNKGRISGLDDTQCKKILEWFDLDIELHPDTVCLYLNPYNGFFQPGKLDGTATEYSNNGTSGFNSGGLNEDLSYLFSMKNLGWANIDRLAIFPNTYKGNLEVDVRGLSDTVFASIALVVSGSDIYIPGYKMKNGNYAFTHGDFENVVSLPMNEPAVIIATYNDGDKDYFGTKKIRIGSRDEESLSMLQRNKKTALKEIERLF